MEQADLEKLQNELLAALARSPEARVAVVGRTPTALKLQAYLSAHGLASNLLGLYAPDTDGPPAGRFAPIRDLAAAAPDIVVVAEDTCKESLLDEIAAHVVPPTRIVIGGYGHLAFRDDGFDRSVHDALVPSLANGYPNCLVHLYQSLRHAARQKLRGVVVEFGMFRGGTTMLLSKFVEELGQDWKVIGFDTFGGFPPPRSTLDLYAHPDCVFRDVEAVRRQLAGRNVEIVEGDVVDTATSLAGEDIVLAFVDTDNYTSANRVVDVVADRVVKGGSIVFDHWTGAGRHLYTIGERMAARRLAGDVRYHNLHGTGVFLRVV